METCYELQIYTHTLYTPHLLTHSHTQVGRLREFPEHRQEPTSDAHFLTSSQRIGRDVGDSVYVHPFTDTRTLPTAAAKPMGQNESKEGVQGRERKMRYVCGCECV
jgi:hypothetical protein